MPLIHRMDGGIVLVLSARVRLSNHVLYLVNRMCQIGGVKFVSIMLPRFHQGENFKFKITWQDAWPFVYSNDVYLCSTLYSGTNLICLCKIKPVKQNLLYLTLLQHILWKNLHQKLWMFWLTRWYIIYS